MAFRCSPEYTWRMSAAVRAFTARLAPSRASSTDPYRPTFPGMIIDTITTSHRADPTRAIRAVCSGIGEEVTNSNPCDAHCVTGPVDVPSL